MIPAGIFNPLIFVLYFFCGIVSVLFFSTLFFPRFTGWLSSHPLVAIAIILFACFCLLFFFGTTYSIWKIYRDNKPAILQTSVELDGFVMPKGTLVHPTSRVGDDWELRNYIKLKFPSAVVFRKSLKVIEVERIINYAPKNETEKIYLYTSSIILKLAEDSIVEGFLCSKDGPVYLSAVSSYELVEVMDLVFSGCTLASTSFAIGMDGIEIQFPKGSKYARIYTPQRINKSDPFEIQHRIDDVYVKEAPTSRF